MVNILVLSVGTRNKIVQYFKENLEQDGNKIGRVIVTDASKYAPAIYEADGYYTTPKIFEENYIQTLIDICKKEDIKAVLSLIDPELGLLAKNKDKFHSLGVQIIGSDSNCCDISLDKKRMFEWLKDHGYSTAKTYDDLESFYLDYENKLIDFPVFVKPKEGSASLSISKVEDIETLNNLFKDNNLIIQEFMSGQEIGVDVYIDTISKEVVSIFSKKKLLMRAGETDKAVSFKDERLFELVSRFAKEFGYLGQIDIDIFENKGEYFISEVNPRFGGGYPHAYECGVNHMKLIINNIQGITNECNIGNYKENIYMLKYNEIMVREIV